MGRICILPTVTGFRFHVKAANGQTVATGETYGQKAACRKGALSAAKLAVTVPITDRTLGQSGCNPQFEIYEDRAGAYRFRLLARNGKIVAVSQGYSSKAGCLGGIASFRENAADPVICEDQP